MREQTYLHVFTFFLFLKNIHCFAKTFFFLSPWKGIRSNGEGTGKEGRIHFTCYCNFRRPTNDRAGVSQRCLTLVQALVWLVVPGVKDVLNPQRPIWKLLLPFVHAQGQVDAIFPPRDHWDPPVGLGRAVQEDIAPAHRDGIRRLQQEAQWRESLNLETWRKRVQGNMFTYSNTSQA